MLYNSDNIFIFAKLKKLNSMELNDQTKISFKPNQIFAAIGVLIVLVGTYISIDSRLSAMEATTIQQSQYGREIQFIRESVIRIEGKLDLKQDKYEGTRIYNQ